jgi:CheY-like chemotaxis protein
MELETIPFDMHEMLAACREIVMPRALEKGLDMYFYAEPSIGKIIYGDPTRLRQVLVNLLSNAVKFTDSGMVKMMVTVKEVRPGSVTLSFEIKDSGIGIEPEQLAKIFEPFIQADSGTARKFGGTGLGLTITKNIIEAMGGKLNVSSMPGIGSKFTFEITFDAVNQSRKRDNESSGSKQIISSEPEKPSFEGEVLLCEDNAMNRQVVCEHLERVGLKTTTAQNGKEGLMKVRERTDENARQFDIILMDIFMPVMDGIEAAAKILEINPAIPIIALTANIMESDREKFLADGFRDCVGKPFTSQELWTCLGRYL